MTAAPLAPRTPRSAAALAGSGLPSRLTGAPDLRAFVEATRTALRFLDLPPADLVRVRSDVALLEQEASRDVVRPRLVAGLRFAIETTVERHVTALA